MSCVITSPTGIITSTRSTVTQWNSRETVP